jgi:O-antigen/teichoic acid export membrane protein
MKPMSSFLSRWKREGAAGFNRITDRVTGELGVVFGGHLIRQALGVISSAILARTLGPERLSVFSVVGAAMMMAITIGDFGLSSSAVRYVAADLETHPDQARTTVRIFAVLKLLGGLTVAAVSLILAGPIAALLNLPAGVGPGLVRLASLGILATTCSGVISTILQALRRFLQLAITQTLNIALTVLLMGALFLGGRLTIANALVVGAVTALAAMSLGWWMLPPQWRLALRSPASLLDRDARRLWHFGRWIWISTMLVILLSQLDLLLLNRWSSSQATGYYALALNLALKAEVLNQTLHTVLLPSVSGLTDREQFAAYTRRSLLRSVLLVGALLLVLPLARPFILAVYGAQYAPSVHLFTLLIGVTMFDVLVNPLLLLAFPLNMPRQIAASHALRVATMLFAGILLIPAWGGPGAVLAKLAAKAMGALFLGSLLLVRLRREKPSVRSDLH